MRIALGTTAMLFLSGCGGAIAADGGVPGKNDRVEGVSTLSLIDMAATKLLANTDRWADDGVFSRDLIDLAMLDLPRPLLQKALAKAETAYRSTIENDLRKSIERLEQRTGRLQECMTALKMTDAPARVWKRIRRLRPRPAAGKLVKKARR